MSQLPYQSFYPPALNPRPTVVTVMAVLGIIFGGIGVLCTPFSLVPYFVNLGQPNPVIDAVKENALLLDYMIFATLLSFLVAILLLTCSIGALKLKPWARTGLVWYGIVGCILAILGLIVNVVWFFPILENMKGNPNQVKGAQMGGMIGGVAGAVFGLALPLAMWIVMTRPSIKAAFEGANAPDATPPVPPTPPMGV